MKARLLAFVLMLFILMSNIQVFADESGSIALDGEFEDWVDKPFVLDAKHDIETTWMDFLQVGYFTDNEYLYLKVERLSAEKSEPWHFSAVMLNALEGNKIEQHPFGEEPVYAPQFDIITHYDENRSSQAALVDVYFEGQLLESTLSSEDNAKTIEFRVPLRLVGLDGMNKEVQFMLKSDDSRQENVDWVADGMPIIITTGPTFYEFTTVVFFSFVSFAAYKTIKKRNSKVSFS